MTDNFLYSFEFLVDDLLVTRPNCCAPEEYPTCVTLTFRDNAYVDILDRSYGECVDLCNSKCCKCCLFALESPLEEDECLNIHVYKMKDSNCKFLLGASDMPVKDIFTKVTDKFNSRNSMKTDDKYMKGFPNLKRLTKSVNCFECDIQSRPEQYCSTNEVSKHLLPLFNLKNLQTGNIMFIMRITCYGPSIVYSFPFSKICERGCPPSEGFSVNTQVCEAQSPCDSVYESENDRLLDFDYKYQCIKNVRPKNVSSSKGSSSEFFMESDSSYKSPLKTKVNKRYFAWNLHNGSSCSECGDDLIKESITCCAKKGNGKIKKHDQQRSCSCCPPPALTSCKKPKPKRQKPKCGLCSFTKGNQECCCDDCQEEIEQEKEEDKESMCFEPCTIEPSKPNSEAYEEFEASFNNSGIVIRVLKSTHKVEEIDGVDDCLSDDEDCMNECNNTMGAPCNSLLGMLQKSPFVRTQLESRTGGYIVNHPNLPKVRANIKYSGNESCCPENYKVPLNKLRTRCNALNNKIDFHRRQNVDNEQPHCNHISALGSGDTRTCCAQVDPKILRQTMAGKEMDNRKKGIEVCYKTCNDMDSDVFLIKLGSKQASEAKRKTIEIELKTPKQPSHLSKQKVTCETQIREAELDAALNGSKKKGKGKKGKKGRKGKK